MMLTTRYETALQCTSRYTKHRHSPIRMSKKVKHPIKSAEVKAADIRTSESVFSLSALESKLVSYISDPSASSQPFDVSSIPKISRAQAAKEAARKCLCI